MGGEDRTALDRLTGPGAPPGTPAPAPDDPLAGPAWRDAPAIGVLLEEIRADPFNYDFLAVVRRLECLASDRPRFGTSTTPAADAVRFGQEPSLAFAASGLRAVDDAFGSRPPRLVQAFFGLLGPNGPLPLHLTDFIRERVIHMKDRSLLRFLDLFHHRMTGMFYRAWALNQPAVHHDRPADDRFARYVASLCGLGMDSLLGRDEAPDLAKFHYAGRLGLHTKCAEGLACIVEDFFKVPCRLTQFVGQWMDLPADAQCRLGASRSTGQLGRSAIVGRKFWECQQKFRFELGPMSLADFERFLPSGTSFGRLVAWVRNYTCDEYTWEARLVLRAADVPPTKLGSFGRLGWTTWLSTKPFARDAGDLVLQPRN